MLSLKRFALNSCTWTRIQFFLSVLQRFQYRLFFSILIWTVWRCCTFRLVPANLYWFREFIGCPSLQRNDCETVHICVHRKMSSSWISWCWNDTQRNSKCHTESLCRSTTATWKYYLLSFKRSLLRFTCDCNPLVCLSSFSFLSFPEWTHLLLSGPHVPLVPADLKAPVQCSPCKKSNTTSMSPHCPPHRHGSDSVCIVWVCFSLLNQMDEGQ